LYIVHGTETKEAETYLINDLNNSIAEIPTPANYDLEVEFDLHT
jgi:hypothetical protein